LLIDFCAIAFAAVANVAIYKNMAATARAPAIGAAVRIAAPAPEEVAEEAADPAAPVAEAALLEAPEAALAATLHNKLASKPKKVQLKNDFLP
jgi:hypothetical protein